MLNNQSTTIRTQDDYGKAYNDPEVESYFNLFFVYWGGGGAKDLTT